MLQKIGNWPINEQGREVLKHSATSNRNMICSRRSRMAVASNIAILSRFSIGNKPEFMQVTQ